MVPLINSSFLITGFGAWRKDRTSGGQDRELAIPGMAISSFLVLKLRKELVIDVLMVF